MLYLVDVHPRYQAGIDFAKLKAQGYTGAAVKASQGEYLTVAEFADWISRARAAGLIPGAYHWIVAGDGAGQADYFLDRLAAVGGPEGLLIQLDCEDNASLADVQAWCARWTQRTGGHPFLIYTGGWWWRPRAWNGAALTPYLWDSHYLTADLDTVPDDPAAFAARIPADWWTPGYGGWGSATFLQFTSKGDAGGLGNNVDLNATKLTLQQLLALTTTNGDTMDLYDKLSNGYSINNALVTLLARTPTDLSARLDALDAKVDTALTALGAIGSSNPDVAAVLAGLEPRLAELRAQIEADTRDAIADEAEGGATAVRADS